MSDHACSPCRGPAKVLIAGGGVAALEAVLALREHAGERVRIELLSACEHFRYRPLQVLEPFEAEAVTRIRWEDLAGELGVGHVADDLRAVSGAAAAVRTTGGRWIEYDALIVAVGAIARRALPGAVTLGVAGGAYTLRRLIDRVRSGLTRELVFVSPPGCSWPIAIYELALLSARAAERAGARPSLTLVTAEREPLEVLGPEAGPLMRRLLDEAGITLRTHCTPVRFVERRLTLASGERIVAEAAISLPCLTGPKIGGLPHTRDGFVMTGADGSVDGEGWVYAAGDVTDSPIKQGGLAAQQADAVAAHLAARLGAPPAVPDAAPVLRASLLTGDGVRHLTRELDADGMSTGLGACAPWWPPGKIAGRYLVPYLATRTSSSESRYAAR